MSQATSETSSHTGARMARAAHPAAPGGTIAAPPGYPGQPPQAPPRARRETQPPKRKRGKITNGLVALSSAAILSVYAVGYVRTQSADALAGNGYPIPGTTITQSAPVTATTASNGATGNGNGGYFLLTPAVPTTQPAALAPTTDATATTATTSTATTATTAATAVPATTATTPTPLPAGKTTANTTSGAATAPPTTPPTRVAATATQAATATTPPRATATATKAPVAATGQFQDGSYVGTGTSRRGDIEVTLTVQGGKITAAQITRCGTAYPCSRVASLPAEVVARQSASVDHISGATYSTQAFQGAVANAIAQAKGQ